MTYASLYKYIYIYIYIYQDMQRMYTSGYTTSGPSAQSPCGVLARLFDIFEQLCGPFHRSDSLLLVFIFHHEAVFADRLLLTMRACSTSASQLCWLKVAPLRWLCGHVSRLWIVSLRVSLWTNPLFRLYILHGEIQERQDKE